MYHSGKDHLVPTNMMVVYTLGNSKHPPRLPRVADCYRHSSDEHLVYTLMIMNWMRLIYKKSMTPMINVTQSVVVVWMMIKSVSLVPTHNANTIRTWIVYLRRMNVFGIAHYRKENHRQSNTSTSSEASINADQSLSIARNEQDVWAKRKTMNMS
jgi:hypothetical protein